MTKKTFTEKLRTNKWIVGTFVLGITCILLLVNQFIISNSQYKNLVSPETLCSKISPTPSWRNLEGNLIATGFRPVGNQSKEFVDFLIKEKIYFIYNLNCGVCQRQIEDFGLNWERYVQSKLTIDCTNLR